MLYTDNSLQLLNRQPPHQFQTSAGCCRALSAWYTKREDWALLTEKIMRQVLPLADVFRCCSRDLREPGIVLRSHAAASDPGEGRPALSSHTVLNGPCQQ